MQPRRIQERLNFLMQHAPAVVLLGPRQAGKTTLAIEVGGGRKAVDLSLEKPKVSFSDHRDDFLILDEVQRGVSSIRAVGTARRGPIQAR